MKAISYLDIAFSLAEEARDEEQDCLDNMPENLEGSYRYEKMDNAVDKLEDALASIEEARDSLTGAAE